MRCHYCDAPAVYDARSGPLKVGLCEEHLRERMESFPAEEVWAALRSASAE